MCLSSPSFPLLIKAPDYFAVGCGRERGGENPQKVVEMLRDTSSLAWINRAKLDQKLRENM